MGIDYFSRSGPTRIYNASGEEVPPYACMELDYNFESGKAATELQDEEVVARIVKPTSNSETNTVLVLFNGPLSIPIDSYGSGWAQPVGLVLFDETDGAVDPGDTVGPKAGSWFMTAAGSGWTNMGYDGGQAWYISATQRTIFVRVASGSGCGTFFQFQLLTDWYGGLAVAYKRTMDGTAAGDPLYVTLRDPLGIFSYQREGSKGYMVKECNKYYAIQGPCDNANAPTPSTGAGAGACCISLSGTTICEEMTETECTSMGGTFQGSGTSCDPNPC